MLDELPPLEALLPQAARIVLTEPAATPVRAVRRRKARRSKPGRSLSGRSRKSRTSTASWAWSVSDIALLLSACLRDVGHMLCDPAPTFPLIAIAVNGGR